MLKISVRKLKSKNITITSEKSGAQLAAKSLLQSRRAFIQPTNQKRQAPSGKYVENNTLASKRPRTDADTDTVCAAAANLSATASVTTSSYLNSILWPMQPNNAQDRVY